MEPRDYARWTSMPIEGSSGRALTIDFASSLKRISRSGLIVFHQSVAIVHQHPLLYSPPQLRVFSIFSFQDSPLVVLLLVSNHGPPSF
jgi:hypothetical protein